MDDDLLADDGQYKDDGLDDLDIDAEAALLGLSDEEIDDARSTNDDQELEYVDEEGNPVSIEEGNADLYEVANIDSDKLSNTPDEDVLELDLDAELESFTQENTDLLTNDSPLPTKCYGERQRKDNLISLTKRKEQERPPLKRRESRYSPEENQDRSNKDQSFSNQSLSRVDRRDHYDNELEYDEESEDESIADDHRERFKSERSNIITLTPAKRRTDIPDTLESVISVEETAKVQAFLENEQKRKMRFKGSSRGRQPRFQRPNQNYTSAQVLPPTTQFSSATSTSMNQTTTTAPQPRKILINPHFRGVRLPPATEQNPIMSDSSQVSIPPSSYDNTNYAPPPPIMYSHPEPVHPVNIAPPPIYTAPPPTVQYKLPEYHHHPLPQQHIQQMPPAMWQSPEMTVPSYSNPPPVHSYGDSVVQASNYNNYNQNYPNITYQNPPPMPIPQTVNYSQPPPPVHLHSPSFPQPPTNQVSTSIGHPQYGSTISNPVRMQQISVQPHSYQESVPMSQAHVISQHASRNNFPHQNQRFSRPPEKRTSNMNIKQVPVKQARMDHSQRKTNVHVNSSNIREIPLVDNLPRIRKASANKVVPIIEDEDEKTKELRIKIEEQKLLREQILKRKEERRRQMAAQRLIELKKRQAEQNKNNVTIVQKAVIQSNRLKVATPVKPALKPSVKERIGLPLKQNVPTTKKKIVVVRKKTPQDTAHTINNTTTSSPAIVGQRLKFPVPTQKQKTQQNVSKPVTAQQNSQIKPKPTSNANISTSQTNKPTTSTDVQTKTTTTIAATRKSEPSTSAKKIILTSQKGKAMRPGSRSNFQQRPSFLQHQRMQRPRICSSRSSHFPPSSHFIEHRMPFHNQGPINDIRMPPPHFQEPRPPLLPFHPHREPAGPGPFNHFFPHDMPFEPNNPHFRMRGPSPGLPNFRPRTMDPLSHDRFPPHQFGNQIPQMRPMYENNMQRFPRQRFHHQGKHKFSANNVTNQKGTNQSKTVEQKKPVSPAPSVQISNENAKNNNNKTIEEKKESKVALPKKNGSDDKDIPSKTQSVSVENLSSSTSEAQLKKLCSSVGVVETIQLIKSERKAVIKFKEPRQALNFQKKYQRYMLDLAMIQVSLLST